MLVDIQSRCIDGKGISFEASSEALCYVVAVTNMQKFAALPMFG